MRSYASVVGQVHHHRSLQLSRERTVTVKSRVSDPVISLGGITQTLESLPSDTDKTVNGLTIIVSNMCDMPVQTSYGLYHQSRTIYLANDGFKLDPTRVTGWVLTLHNYYRESYGDYMTQFVLLHELGHAHNHMTEVYILTK